MRDRDRLPFLIAICLFAFAALAVTRPASASLIMAMDTPSMVQRADHIVVADVVSTRSAWDERHTRIFTTTELVVVESWKGATAPATHLTIVQPGGTVDDLTMVTFGFSRFAPGERALLFLAGNAGDARVVGMAQGKRLLRRDASSGRWMVQTPDRAGAAFLRPPSTNGSLPVFETQARPLDDVRAEMRDLIIKAKTR
jgi:hypothetical protein